MQVPANMPRDVMCHELEMKPGFCECGGLGIRRILTGIDCMPVP